MELPPIWKCVIGLQSDNWIDLHACVVSAGWMDGVHWMDLHTCVSAGWMGGVHWMDPHTYWMDLHAYWMDPQRLWSSYISIVVPM